MTSRHSFEDRLAMVKEVCSGSSIIYVAKEHGACIKQLRDWVRVYELYGEERLRLWGRPNHVSNAEKERMCRLFLEKGVPLRQIYIPNNVSREALRAWISKVRQGGYRALYGMSQICNETAGMIKSINESLLEELKKAQHENLVLRAENALLKKVKALMEEEESRLKAIGRKPSKH